MAVAVPPGHVLVATDLSPRAGLALIRAAQLAHEHGARLTVLHVVPAEIVADMADPARRTVEAHLVEYLDSAPVDIAIRRGPAAGEIAAEAAEHEVDLVVVGAHGADWPNDVLLGSTAENLVRMTPAPVLLVKQPTTAAYRTVILAVDMSPPAADSARLATRMTPTADHYLVHVCTVVGENLMRMYGVGDDQIETLRRTSTRQAREHIAQLTETLNPRPSQVKITSGHPRTRVLELCRSWAADLVVVGTGARSPMSYAVLGSVAQHVMRQTRADVLVVPAAEA